MSGAVSEFQIVRFVNFINGIEDSESLLNNLKQSTEDLYNHFSTSQRTVRSFQDQLTKISSFLCNRENVIDDITELLKRTEIPKDLKQYNKRYYFLSLIFSKIYENPIDDNYVKVIQELKEILETGKELQKQGFIIGYEMQKDLDPLIDKTVKRILSTCTEMLNLNKGVAENWHEIQQQNLLPKSELIEFVEENRPSASSPFIGKYCDLSSSFYSACAKRFFEELKQREKHVLRNQKTSSIVLIGDPIEGDDIRTRRRSSLKSFFYGKSRTNSSESPLQSPSTTEDDDGALIQTKFIDIPYSAAHLLIELLRRESGFFKEFFGSSYVRRKSFLSKIFSKCFNLIKNNLKEIISDNSNCLDSLRMMSEVTNLEVQVVSMSDLSSPTQWLNEVQNCLFEDFKRILKKQIESLTNYSELKISLTSSELRHHFVVKRFSNFMKNSLEILKTFQRPWDIVQVELKKLEHSFYNWMAKISSYLKDRREILLFQINNYDLVIETCSSVAGADFMASLHFKFDPLLDKFIKSEQERYFYDLLLILKEESNPSINNEGTFKDINKKLKESFKAVIETFNSSTFTDFANFSVSELVRQKFAKESLDLYKKYYEFYENKYGKLQEELDDSEIIVTVEEIERIIYTTTIK